VKEYIIIVIVVWVVFLCVVGFLVFSVIKNYNKNAIINDIKILLIPNLNDIVVIANSIGLNNIIL
jgi:hypothetical protein